MIESQHSHDSTFILLIKHDEVSILTNSAFQQLLKTNDAIFSTIRDLSKVMDHLMVALYCKTPSLYL